MSQQNHENAELSQQITEVVQKSVDGLVKKLTSIFLKREKILIKQIQQLDKVSTRHCNISGKSNSEYSRRNRKRLSGKRKKKYLRDYSSSSSDTE